MTISEREKAKPKCPRCKSTNFTPQFSGFMAQTSKKS
jgi:phage FluMu protein Com